MGKYNQKLSPDQVQDRVCIKHGDEIYIVKSTYKNMLTKALFVDKIYGEW